MIAALQNAMVALDNIFYDNFFVNVFPTMEL
jgi:hypothetical protein